MKNFYRRGWLLLAINLLWNISASGQDKRTKDFLHPSGAAKPWVYWYWMDAAVSRTGIKADLEAMKAAGIGGVYLMPINGQTDPPLIQPPVVQLSPAWWGMMKYALQEAGSLGLKLAIHVCDGFATAGGPWITPGLSMQKVVWSKVNVKGGRIYNDTLPSPETNDAYYRDIAVFAFPSSPGSGLSTNTIHPEVTASIRGEVVQFLADPDNEKNFVSHDPCWIQYAFKKPFTCRSLKIRVRGISFQAYRLLIEVSNDGKIFHTIGRLKPARSGWEDYAEPEATYAIRPVTARFFRFVYDPAGTEPGSEDLDAAKWRPTLKLCGIVLFSKPQINQFEGKNGEVWRISDRSTAQQIPDSLCVPAGKIINITADLRAGGRLIWKIPPGEWTILRMGHTSTGQMNTTGGGGKGLECDKFNPAAVRLQFNHWFSEVYNKAGGSLAAAVLKVFHVDSWECGSQNWSPVFRREFKKRRGYDLLPYLPVMAGIPIQNADISERFLYDVRRTIAELLADNFFGTLAGLAHEKHCLFSAESVAPTMVSDGMLHYSKVDIPMGEFWLRSPTHDKPNDILDAVSGGHIYGRPVIQAESFTELREGWDEYPGMLKKLEDRNYVLGINRLVYHVFTENPWMDRKPGMTLNGVGLYFQRDQTWWKPGRAWVQYAQRCQALLQLGHPVTDIAVFTGEEVPRRAILPDRLVPLLPGIFGKGIVAREQARLANTGEPMQEIPAGVKSSANITGPGEWIDPLHGYAYDSFNQDALLRLAKVQNGRIVLPGGASYGLLIVPGCRRMQPEGDLMTKAVAERLLQLVKAGATVMLFDAPRHTPGLYDYRGEDKKVQQVANELLGGKFEIIKTGKGEFLMRQVGKGRVIRAPFYAGSFEMIGLNQDLIAKNADGHHAQGIAWTHRTAPGKDIYFISNQLDSARTVQLSLRASGRQPELYNAVTNEKWEAENWQFVNGRTVLPVRLERDASLFVILEHPARKNSGHEGNNWLTPVTARALNAPWMVSFNEKAGGPQAPVIFNELKDWREDSIAGIHYYSGTAVYTRTFAWKAGQKGSRQVWLDLGCVADIAEIKVNGIDCGVAWTYPYRSDITKAIRSGNNLLEIDVTNTWANRLIGDQALPENKRITRTTVPFYLKGKLLLPSGLLGPVKIECSD